MVSLALLGFQVLAEISALTKALLPGWSGRAWSNSSGLRLGTCLESCSTGRGSCVGTLLTTSSSLESPLLCISGENRQSSWSWGELCFNEIPKFPFWPLCLSQLLTSSQYFLNKFVKLGERGELQRWITLFLSCCLYFMVLCLPSSLPVIDRRVCHLQWNRTHKFWGCAGILLILYMSFCMCNRWLPPFWSHSCQTNEKSSLHKKRIIILKNFNWHYTKKPDLSLRWLSKVLLRKWLLFCSRSSTTVFSLLECV